MIPDRYLKSIFGVESICGDYLEKSVIKSKQVYERQTKVWCSLGGIKISGHIFHSQCTKIKIECKWSHIF